jgi:hypothetical protein
VEIMTLARQHDEFLKEARQDLFRAETKLRVERLWKWPIRLGCVALGVAAYAAWQTPEIHASVVAGSNSFMSELRSSGIEVLAGIVVGGAAIIGLAFLIQRWLAGPTPEQKARKLMEEFARADGVAAYVFTPHDDADGEAAMIGALTRKDNKKIRQRRLDNSNRLLSAQMAKLLNRPFETEQDKRLRQMIEGGERRSETA